MIVTDPTFRLLCRTRDLLAGPESLPIPLIAAQANMSPFHFIRRYEALFGVTPHQFRIDRRIERAKLLLASRELSVTETCMEVGMSSLGSFSDLFLRRVGVSPSAYQRRARAMISVPGMLPTAVFPGCLNLLANLPADARLRRD